MVVANIPMRISKTEAEKSSMEQQLDMGYSTLRDRDVPHTRFDDDRNPYKLIYVLMMI